MARKTVEKDATVKPRKKRKPMTPEQRQAAGERLAKAREKRLLENPPQYLRDGVYCDTMYGEHQQNKILYRCVAMAYHPDGTPKRSTGVFYPDLGRTWTGEIHDEEEG
mgnify:CR=1 FL=1